MTKKIPCHIRLFLWVVAILLPLCVRAEELPRFYHLEVGAQAGMAYYMGELAPYAFMSSAELYGAQLRIKINPRFAIQVKGQRMRVINIMGDDNEWGIVSGCYQVPMWHTDVVGEYNFYRLGLNEYDINMKPITPYVFLGVGLSAQNVYASCRDGEYPRMAKGTNKDYSMYVPVGVGVKWKFADRWQLQFAWQHNVYLVNGDGLEGVIDARRPNLFNDSYKMNGSNIMNNDVTSTLTLGVVFEFGCQQRKCVFCDYKD